MICVRLAGGECIRPYTACREISMATTINGTSGNDVIAQSSNGFGVPPTAGYTIANPNGDDFVINGLGGNDRIQTGDRADTIMTLGGDDWILAGNGNNVVNAGDGANTITT